MELNSRLLRAVAGQFLMGATIGAMFAGILLTSNTLGIMTMIVSSTSPVATIAIILASSILYFAFGAAITGFMFLVSNGTNSDDF